MLLASQVAVHGPHKGILPCQDRVGGQYPLVDMSIWLRSCTHEVVDPVVGKVTGTIPQWLEGNFLQNGPGKFYFGANDVFQHLFDGSALVQKYIGRTFHIDFLKTFLKARIFLYENSFQKLGSNSLLGCFAAVITLEP